MKQIPLSKKIGISQGHLSKVLAGRQVGRRTYEKIAAVLGNGHKWHDIAALSVDRLNELIKGVNSHDEQ